MVSDCWNCKHSVGADRNTASRLLCLPNYRMGKGELKENMALICEPHFTVYPAPYAKCGYERAPGSDDE